MTSKFSICKALPSLKASILKKEFIKLRGNSAFKINLKDLFLLFKRFEGVILIITSFSGIFTNINFPLMEK